LLLTSLLTAATVASPVQVQFIVVVPDEQPEQPPRIYLGCNVDGWKEDGRPLERLARGVYGATFPFESGLDLQYKFLREPKWATVEKAPDGAELGNRTLRIESGRDEIVVVHAVQKWADRPVPARRQVTLGGSASAADTPPPVATKLTGDIRYHHAVHSPQLNNDRSLIVYLPPGYAGGSERYPVLYMHDGQNLFDARTSFAGVEWGVDETAERLIQAGQLRRLIIVGIFNNADRMGEYTPFKEGERGGEGDAYLAFIVETVKPFIDRTYRTQPGRDTTAIAGSSLGGLISLYAAYKYPDVFGAAGVVSPALGWANQAVPEYVRTHKPTQAPRIWLDMGTEEWPEGKAADGTPLALEWCRALVKTFADQGMRAERDFHYDEVAGAKHNEAAWAQRCDRLLLFLFGSAPAASAPAPK
jgi:predicted alpha/beta superfamily hydrolase